MRLAMAGIDYTTAPVEVRESFAPPPETRREILRNLLDGGPDGGIKGGVTGAVLLSTCNRSELYLSYSTDVPPDGAALFCRALGRDAGADGKWFTQRDERQAAEHLLRVAGGLCSSVPGDDQIITQVRAAVDEAREAGAASPILEALFRAAVAAGKKVRTDAPAPRAGASVAAQGVDAAERLLDGLSGKKALVIGNGVIGRLAASGLLERGCAVRLTLRDPGRRGEMPAGCECVDFEKRYDAMDGCDLVVSATSSPRHTVELPGIMEIKKIPRLFVDLAMPRDVDPSVGQREGVSLVNLDDLVRPEERERGARVFAADAERILAAELSRFDLWRRNRAHRSSAFGHAPDFPIFINIRGGTVFIAGGGKVAARRAEKLLSFGASVRVASPAGCPALERLSGREGFHWTREEYRPEHLDGAVLAIAATDDREVNRRVGLDARERGVLVSVADRRDECTFYFPAIVRSDTLTAGLVSNNGDHRMVRSAAAELLEKMEAMDEDYQGGQSRQPAGDDAGADGDGGDSGGLSGRSA